MIGDRVQAKWEDGKMYFGKVLQVHEGIKQMIKYMYGAKTACISVCAQIWSMFCSMMVWNTQLLLEQLGEG